MGFRDKDKLLRHSILLIAATMLAHAANVLFQMIMMRRLPISEYGAMAAMLGLASIASIPLEAARTAVARLSARQFKTKRNMIGRFLRRWIIAASAGAVVLLAMSILARTPIASFFQIEEPATVIIALAGIGVLLFSPLFAGALQGIQAFRPFAIMTISSATGRLVAGALLVCILSASASAALAAQGLGAAIGVGVGSLFLVSALRRTSSEPSAVQDGDVICPAYLLKSLLVLSAYAVLMQADVAMVKHFFEPVEAGAFARAATIARSIIFLPMPIAVALFPKVVSSGSDSDVELESLRRALLYAAILIVVAFGAAWLLAGAGWRLFAGDWPDPRSLRLVRLTIAAMAPLGLTFIGLNFELAQSRFRRTLYLVPLAVGYVAAVSLWHDTVWSVIAIMGAANLASALLVTARCAIRKRSSQ